MVIIKVNENLNAAQAQALIEGIHAQAGRGVIVLPNFCELLNEVPEDEEIKVIQQSKADQVAELEAKLAKAAAQKWIPVTERLPEDNERVLVYHDDGVIRFGINKDGFYDAVSTLYLKHNHHTCFSKATHWIPLPEPPKGE